MPHALSCGRGQPSTWLSRHVTAGAHGDAITSLVHQIASIDAPRAIPRIISLALDNRREVAEAAGVAVKQLLERVSVRHLGVLDRAFRDVSPWTHPASQRWSGILVRAFEAADEVLRPHVLAYVARWLSRESWIFVGPSPSDVAPLRALIGGSSLHVDVKRRLAGSLEAHVRSVHR